MTDKLLEIIGREYRLSEIDAGEASHLRAGGMKFSIKAYNAEGLGHVSVMKASGFFGLMKMDTLIINPTKKDMPLYSYDRIYAMGNDTLIVELYDTLLNEYNGERLNEVKTRYAGLPERDPGEHWYDSIKLPESISKKGRRTETEVFDRFTEEHFEAYMSSSSTEVDDVCAKLERAAVYVNGLLEKGGPSTDVFKKSLGEEKTGELFRKILFGLS